MEHSTYSGFSNPAEWVKACTGPNVVINELEPMVDEPKLMFGDLAEN